MPAWTGANPTAGKLPSALPAFSRLLQRVPPIAGVVVLFNNASSHRGVVHAAGHPGAPPGPARRVLGLVSGISLGYLAALSTLGKPLILSRILEPSAGASMGSA